MSHNSLDSARELASYKHALDIAAIFAITDKAGRLIYVNDKFVDISGYSRAELLGQTHRIINSGHHSKQFFENMWKIISKGQMWTGEICNRAKNGNLYWVQTTIIPFLDEEGRPYQYVAIRFEVTDRKKAEAQVVFQDRLASVGLLASSLAHEIGTPLGIMRGRAELLSNQLKENKSAGDGLKTIIQQIDRISGLIKSLLNLARGDSESRTGTGNIANCINDVTKLMAHEFRRKNIDLVIDVPESCNVKIGIDVEPLHQVYLNLLINSLHAIEENLKKDNFKKNYIKISVHEEDQYWVTNVEDSGCGISPKNMKNLFKPFFTTKDVGVGTGLGLATSYKIIKSWGGDIKVKSTENQGTVFSVLLPKG